MNTKTHLFHLQLGSEVSLTIHILFWFWYFCHIYHSSICLLYKKSPEKCNILTTQCHLKIHLRLQNIFNNVDVLIANRVGNCDWLICLKSDTSIVIWLGQFTQVRQFYNKIFDLSWLNQVSTQAGLKSVSDSICEKKDWFLNISWLQFFKPVCFKII